MITFSSLYHRREESQAEVSIQDEVTELLKDEVPLHCFFNQLLGYALKALGICKIQPQHSQVLL